MKQHKCQFADYPLCTKPGIGHLAELINSCHGSPVMLHNDSRRDQYRCVHHAKVIQYWAYTYTDPKDRPFYNFLDRMTNAEIQEFVGRALLHTLTNYEVVR